MRIDSGHIRQEAVSSYVRVGWKRTSAGFSRKTGAAGEELPEEGLFSGYLKDHGDEVRSMASERTKGISSNRKTSSSLNKIRLSCVDYLFWLLFARKNRAYGSLSEGAVYEAGYGGGSSPGLSLSYSSESFSGEYESAAYRTQGTVRTGDGRELSFELSFEMTRAFEEYYSESHSIASIPQMLNLMDPLVINLDSDIASLSDQKFTFDLNADGETEELSLLGRGSGFLALDLNENGQVDDGRELFGAISGSGFGELSAFDQDHNGWIDENDEIFEKLRIWIKDEDGTDRLFPLKEKGVGAINLNALATGFSHYGSEGNLNGILRSTSFFLYEDGTAGTVQHLDLAS